MCISEKSSSLSIAENNTESLKLPVSFFHRLMTHKAMVRTDRQRCSCLNNTSVIAKSLPHRTRPSITKVYIRPAKRPHNAFNLTDRLMFFSL